jgi:hypothetical protein
MPATDSMPNAVTGAAATGTTDMTPAFTATTGASSMSLLIPVMERNTRSWPKFAKGRVIRYMALARALTDAHGFDAHTAAYSTPRILRRLATTAFEHVAVQMILLIVDVDTADHTPPTSEWLRTERGKLDRLLAAHPGGYIYRTGAGYRILYVLAEPLVLGSAADAWRWTATYHAWLDYLQACFAIVGDRSAADWPRLFRLPHVVRDGRRQRLGVLGDAEAIGIWSVAVEVPVPASVQRSVSTSSTAHPEDERLQRARAYVAEMEPAVQGERGSAALFRAVCRVMHGFDLNDEVTRSIIIDEYNPRCRPPWSEREIDRKIAEARSRARDTNKWHVVTRAGWVDKARYSRREPSPGAPRGGR